MANNTIFRQEEKQYMAKKNLNMSNVIDLENIDTTNETIIYNVANNKPVYSFAQHEGLYILPKYLSNDEQKSYVSEAYYEYVKYPPYMNNIANLDNDVIIDKYEKNIRWCRLGESYDWNSLSYDNKYPSVFPHNLKQCVKNIVNCVEKVDLSSNTVYKNYNPEVAFVNYYSLGNTMMAHQDKSEYTMDRPLVSISLGCSAIFLIGTEDKKDKPTAFLLRSGDVVCMTGKSRLAYHGVPKIINDCPVHLFEENNIKEMRININVRQVFA